MLFSALSLSPIRVLLQATPTTKGGGANADLEKFGGFADSRTTDSRYNSFFDLK